MADKKISQLTGATTPLAGTEVLPIVQSGATVQVSIANVTAGRAVTASTVTVGNARTRFGSSYIADVPAPTGNNTGIVFGGNTIFPCDGTGTLTNGVASLGTAAYKWYDIFLENNVVIGNTGKGITTGSSIPLGLGVNNTVTAITIDTSSNVGIGTASPAATAILDVQSTTKGVRFPNMTTTQKTAFTPSAGTVVFDTTLAKLCVYSGAAWQTITSI